MRRIRASSNSREEGFTLVELLVVILVIAILAGIAVMVFLRQKEKSFQSQIQSGLKAAALAAEDYGVENDGDLSGLDGDTGPLLSAHGFTRPSWVNLLTVKATDTAFCIRMRHSEIRPGISWRLATYRSDLGRALVANNCP
jgi:type IV pilus assembly protein PilA